MAQSDTCKEKFKDYNCDEGLEAIHVWFCYHIWSFYGKDLLEEHEEFSVDVSLLKRRCLVTKRMVEILKDLCFQNWYLYCAVKGKDHSKKYSHGHSVW